MTRVIDEENRPKRKEKQEKKLIYTLFEVHIPSGISTAILDSPNKSEIKSHMSRLIAKNSSKVPVYKYYFSSQVQTWC